MGFEMRSFGTIIIGCLLASCGSPGPDKAPESNSEAQSQAEPPVGNSSSAHSASSVQANSIDTGAATPNEPAHPCRVQGEQRVEVASIHGLGTEPFWSVDVQGRCVTYSTPEDQKGVRVWTRYSGSKDGGGEWVGHLNGKPFRMVARPQAGCSDGMSDKRYPIAVELFVGGEKRLGCAEPR